MDAMAAAAARGCSLPRVRTADVVVPALLFGGAQALMPALGWGLGRRFGGWVEELDHWFAFLVLGAIGAKMLYEALGAPEQASAPAGLRTLLLLAIATSIDAFAAGLTLPLLGAPFAASIAMIGAITALLSGLGVVLGRHFGALLGRKLDVLGGALLILLGCKILVEHLSA